ncbi:winged helix-turn-helix domain-containing protein [Pantoea sp. FN060301]|uniref:winged helix-turn-helix domain-containing protein n=1 Tax=Pantoea sp. FN060301 TaxID=3420380 RepID=UPI003D165B18
MFYTINGAVIFNSVKHTIVSCQPGSGKECKLNQPASRCLLLLIQNNGKTISQERFIDEVWRKKGMEVAVNTFYQNISILRKALRSCGLDERVVITVPKKGIMLHAEIEEQPDPNSIELSTENVYALQETLRIKREKPQLKIIYILVTILTLLLINTLFFFFFLNKHDPSLYPDYRYQTLYNGCKFYTNTSLTYKIKETEKLNGVLDCQNYAFVYLTLYSFSKQASLLMCSSELSTAGAKSCYIKFIKEPDFDLP